MRVVWVLVVLVVSAGQAAGPGVDQPAVLVGEASPEPLENPADVPSEAPKAPPFATRFPIGRMQEPWQGEYCTQYWVEVSAVQPVALGIDPRYGVPDLATFREAHARWLRDVAWLPWVEVANWREMRALVPREGGTAVVAFTDALIESSRGAISGIACNGQAVVSLGMVRECPEVVYLHEVGHLLGKPHGQGIMAPSVDCGSMEAGYQ